MFPIWLTLFCIDGMSQAWELIDPPCGWDVQGPVLATGFYDITPSAIQMAMLMDDALSDACSAGSQKELQTHDTALTLFCVLFAYTCGQAHVPCCTNTVCVLKYIVYIHEQAL